MILSYPWSGRWIGLWAWLAAGGMASGAALLVETFAYPEGELAGVSGGRWTVLTMDKANPALQVKEGSLEWNVPAVVTGTGEINGYYGTQASATTLTAGALYASFDLTVGEAPQTSNGGLIAAFWGGGTSLRGRLWIGTGRDAGGVEVPGTFRLGLTDGSGTSASVVWHGTAWPAGATVAVVLKYDLGAGVARLYLNPQSESDPYVQADDASTLGMKGFAVRHRTNVILGRFRIDDLVISQSFDDRDPPTDFPPSALEALGVPGGGVYLRWLDRSQGETGYTVERRVAGTANFVTLGTTPANIDHFLDETAATGVAHEYRVSALGQPGLEPSNLASATPWPPLGPVGPVTTALRPRAGGGATLFLTTGERVFSQVEESADLRSWTDLGFAYSAAATEVAHDWPSPPAGNRYYRARLTLRELPPAGLTGPFAFPAPADGPLVDLSAYGVVPNDDADDGASLQRALNAARAGQRVFLPAGVYRLQHGVVLPSRIVLSGAGPDQTILEADGIPTAVEIPAEREDVTVRDLAIVQRAGASGLDYGILVSEKTATNNARRILLQNLRVEGFTKTGLSLRSCHHVAVFDCRILNATALGGGGEGYGVAINDPTTRDVWVRGCTIGPVIRHAILLQYQTHRNLIEGNLAYGNTEDCYDLHGEDEYGNELRHNVARDSERDGFGVGNTGATHDRSGPDNWIHHNEVYGCLNGLEVIQGSDAVYLDHNHFHDNREAGIRLHDGGGRQIHVRGNRLVANRRGLDAAQAAYLRVEDNTITGHLDEGLVVSAAVARYVIVRNDLRGNRVAKSLLSADGTYADNLEP